MKKPAWLILLVICAVAGLALGVTNAFTKKAIEERVGAKDAEALRAVMSGAEDFEQLELAENAAVGDVAILACYRALKGGVETGKVVKTSVQGYRAEIEVIVGILPDGGISGISCGGEKFAETPDLGSKVKDEEFTSQFEGLKAPVALAKDGGEVDAVTSATVSSRAVVKAVNAALEYAAGIQ